MEALETALKLQFDPDPVFCFMRLSRADLTLACHDLGVSRAIVTQHPTKHSILLKSDSVFWKCTPHLNERDNVERLSAKLTNPKHITLDSSLYICDQKFYRIPAHIPPLRKSEVQQCLCDFMTRTATALSELHKFGFAHLDVRVPNICFAEVGNEYIVKLIDLDRCAEDEVVDLSCYSGEMYQSQLGWKASQYDWKQLGLLAAEIVFDLSHKDIVKDPRMLRDQCLRELITDFY